MQNMYGKVFLFVVLCGTLSCVQCDKYCISGIESKDNYLINVLGTEPKSKSGCFVSIDRIDYEVKKNIPGELCADPVLLMKDGTTRKLNRMCSQDGHEDVCNKLAVGGTPKTGSNDGNSITEQKYTVDTASVNDFDMESGAAGLEITVYNSDQEIVGIINVEFCSC